MRHNSFRSIAGGTVFTDLQNCSFMGSPSQVICEGNEGKLNMKQPSDFRGGGVSRLSPIVHKDGQQQSDIEYNQFWAPIYTDGLSVSVGRLYLTKIIPVSCYNIRLHTHTHTE